MKVDHFAVQVADLERAIRFYTESFGLKLMFKEVDRQQHEAFAFLELEGGNLELLQKLDAQDRPAPFAPPSIQPPYCPHLALRTDDMAKLVATAKARGVPIVKGPLVNPGLCTWIYLSDPDHNVLEFIQWFKPAR